MPVLVQQQGDTPPRTHRRPLRAAVIGLGVGEAHLAGYLAHPGCDVAALCDFDRHRLVEAAERCPEAELCESAADVLEDPSIDAVSIASYDNHHYEQIVGALEHDKHVFVEKPMCLSREEARHIRKLLTGKPHLRFSSNLILRLCPRFAAIKEKIDRGDFGELFMVSADYHYGRLHKITSGWRGAIDYYSVVYGGAVHVIDLLRWLTGARIVDVAAFGNQIASRGSQFRFNDTVVSSIRFDNGISGHAGVTYGCVRPHTHDLAIFGTQATFINDVPDGKLFASRDPGEAPTPVREPYPGVHKGALIENFVDSILNDVPLVVGTEEVFATMSVCLAIEEAAASGTVRRVEYL